MPFEWSFISELCRNPKTINTLMSWERQGVSGMDGNCILTNRFTTENPSAPFVINSKLQCHIDSIEINNVCVAHDITTDFWTDRSAFTKIHIPSGVIKQRENDVRIFCRDLAWTGGVSHNDFIIREETCEETEKVKIVIDKDNHLFDSLPDNIDIAYSTLEEGRLRLQIEDSFHKELLDTSLMVSPHDGLISISLESIKDSPGFYQCMATLEGKYISGDIEWLAVSPENLNCQSSRPLEFDDYWENAISQLSAVAPDYKMIFSDSLSTESKKAYIVEMQSDGDLTIRAYYFVPRKEGAHYAILHLPGYGTGFEDLSHLRNDDTDRVDMALCVRGHGISADVFNPGFGVPGIWGYNLHQKDSIAYRSIYLDCVRAVDFLCSRPEVDNAKIGVTGGSQGGGLALATAGLCGDRIAACAYFDPFPCDIPEHVNIRTLCQQEIKNYLDYYDNPCSFSDAMTIQSYIDTRNFAPYIKSKILYATALFDDDCPPQVGFAAYNDITSEKEYIVSPKDSHLGESNHYGHFMKWFDTLFAPSKD